MSDKATLLDRFRLPDCGAIVTGAGKGIGAATARAFAEAGADVVITARTSSDFAKVAEEVAAIGRRALRSASQSHPAVTTGEVFTAASIAACVGASAVAVDAAARANAAGTRAARTSA